MKPRRLMKINTSFYFLSSCSDTCHNQWFDTVTIYLGTSLGFDHTNEKNVGFLTLATFILWKTILLESEVA